MGKGLFEKGLYADAEKTLPTPHPKLRVAQSRAPRDGHLLDELARWLAQPGDTSAAGIRAQLRRWVPEYTPASAGVVAAEPVRKAL